VIYCSSRFVSLEFLRLAEVKTAHTKGVSMSAPRKSKNRTCSERLKELHGIIVDILILVSLVIVAIKIVVAEIGPLHF
jgi:hypothetical protein